MKTQGFDFDPAALANPGVIPASLSQSEAAAYSEALLGRLESPQPGRDRIAELAENVNEGIFDPAHNCLDLARWHDSYFTSDPTSTDESQSFDPSDDAVIGRLAVDFQECIVSQGVTTLVENPELLLLEIQYLEFLQEEASRSGNGVADAGVEAPRLDDERPPLTTDQVDELAAMRAGDFACSGDYYNGFALRMNEINGAPTE